MINAPDDSALIHGRVYDPAKAREYYLRTRQLKGRKAGSAKDATSTSRRSSSGGSLKMRPSRRKELEAQKAALEKRLDRLKEVLAMLVDAAKKRSGVDTKDSKDKAPSKNETSPDKPLTEKQKREKRKASAEQYEAEKKMGLTGEVQQLQEQVRDVLSQIKKAAADSQRKQRLQSETKTASNGR